MLRGFVDLELRHVSGPAGAVDASLDAAIDVVVGAIAATAAETVGV